MAGPNTAQLSVGFNETQLSDSLARGIKSGLNKGFGGFQMSDKGFGPALGRMTAGVKDFDSVLSAANKRVIGFGVSVGLIGGSVRTFQGLIAATREVSINIAKIGSVMALTTDQTQRLSKSLFDLARQTGTSFGEASKAVEAFAKQGGNLTQTLERSKIALALAKVGNEDVEESVRGLISAYDTFGRTGESYLSIANKISSANRTSQASVENIQKAIGQFGAEALDAGVSLSRLIALVSTLNTRTGQSSPQALNRIFARLQNPSSTQKLSQIPGFDINDSNGQIKSGIALLDELAVKYKGFTELQKRTASQAVAGIFNPNTFKSLIADLGDVNGLASNLQRSIDSSTNDLQNRLILQTTNLDQTIKNLQTSAKQVGATIGNLSIAPALNNLAGIGQSAAGLFKNLDGTGSSIGTYIGEGILKGIGNVISGPGLIILGRALTGVVKRTAPEFLNDFKQSAGFGGGRNQDLQVINGINKALALGTQEERNQYKETLSVTKQHEILVGILERELGIQERMNAVGFGAAAELSGVERARFSQFGRNAAGGYLPSMGAESSAIMAGIGGAPSSARPVLIPNFAFGGGVSGPIVANSSEFVVPGAGGSSIYNRSMISKYGLPPGSTPVAAGGFVPNAATGNLPSSIDIAMGKSTPEAASALQAAMARSEQINRGLDQRVVGINQSLSKLSDGFQEWVAREQNIKRQTANISPIYGNESTSNPTRNPNIGPFRDARGRFASSRSIPYNNDYINVSDRGLTKPAQPGDPSFIGPLPGTVFDDVATKEEEFRKREEISRVRQNNIESQAVAAQQRRERIVARGNRLQQALLFSSFGAAFLPEGKGGTGSGEALGALSTGIQGAAIGGQIGSIFGPAAGFAGAGIGGLAGGLYGGFSKSTKSFDEISASIRNKGAGNVQAVNAASQYAQLSSNLIDARASGASIGDLNRIKQEQQIALNDSSLSPQIRASLLAAQTPEEFSAIQGGLVSTSAAYTKRGDALGSIANFARSPNDLDATSQAAQNTAALFAGQNVDLGRLNTGDKNFDLARIKQALTNNGTLDSGEINDAVDQLGKVDIDGLTTFVKQVAKLYEDNKGSVDKLQDVQAKQINIGAIKDSIQQEVDVLESGIDAASGAASFIRRQTSQRVGAAARILGEGRIGSGKASLNSQDLEGNLQIQAALQEAGISNSTALSKTRQSFLSSIDVDSQRNLGDINHGILSATSVDQFRDLAKSLDGLDKNTSAKLDKVVDTLAKTYSQNEKEVNLVKEQVDLQKLEAKASQYNSLISRGGFNLKSIDDFSSLSAASSVAGLGRYGQANNTNASLQQSELLDQLGLPKGPQTVALQNQLRRQSLSNSLATLAARKLGRPVATDSLSLTAAADDLDNTGTRNNRELGDRILKSVSLQSFNPTAAASRILRGSSDIQTSDLKNLSSSGSLSLGDAGIIGGIKSTNDILSDIDQNIASIATGGSVPPTQGSSPETGLGGVAHVFVAHRRKYGAAPDSDDLNPPPLTGTPDKPQSPLSSFAGGFSDSLAGLQNGLDNFRDIGKQTAENLSNSFSKFFGDFATGALKGQNAFRQFAVGILSDESRLFADQGTKQLLGGLGSLISNGAINPAANYAGSENHLAGDLGALATETPATLGLSASSPHYNGGFVRLATGGTVPAMLTGGEYVFTPSQSRRLGGRALRALNNGNAYAAGGPVMGGSGLRDDVPASLAPGSFVIRANSARRLGAGYLNALANGGVQHRAAGGGIGTASFGGDLEAGGIGALVGGLLGLLLDKKNRAQGALIGAGFGFGLGFGANALLGSPVSTAASTTNPFDMSGGDSLYGTGPTGMTSYAASASKGLGDISLGSAGVKIGTGLLLGQGARLLSPSGKPLDYAGVQRNAAQLQGNLQSDINARPAGTFSNMVDGRIIGFNTPASETLYGNYGGRNATAYGYSSGGSVGGYTPLSDGSSQSTVTNVTPVITIHNYGGGNASSSTSVQGGQGSNNPLAGQDFANLLNKHVNAAVQEALVNSQRNGGLFQTKARYSPNSY